MSTLYDKSKDELVKIIRELEDKLAKSNQVAKVEQETISEDKIRSIIDKVMSSNISSYELSNDLSIKIDKAVDLVLEYYRKMR